MVPSTLVHVVGVAFGALLGPEVLEGAWTLIAVADLVLEHGPLAWAASIGRAGHTQGSHDPLRGRWVKLGFL